MVEENAPEQLRLPLRASEQFIAVLEFGELFPTRPREPLPNLNHVWSRFKGDVEGAPEGPGANDNLVVRQGDTP